MYKLACRKDPKKIGIEGEDGTWDMGKFEAHVQECHVCTFLVGRIGKYLSGKGGRKSRRVLSPEQARAMAQKSAERRKKRGLNNAGIL